LAPLALVICLSIPVLGGVHAALGAGFTVAHGGPTFLLNRLVASGVADQTLGAYCETSAWQLCTYQQLIHTRRLEPDSEFWFLWGKDTPRHTLGWEEWGGEQTDIILHSVACCWPEILREGARNIWGQAGRFNSAEDVYGIPPDQATWAILQKYYPRDFASFLNSRQQTDRFDAARLLPWDETGTFLAIVAAAAVFSGVCLAAGRHRYAVFILAAVAFIAAKVVVVGATNGNASRLQGRVIWLVNFSLAAGLAGVASERLGSASRSAGLHLRPEARRIGQRDLQPGHSERAAEATR
jgi:hypothetical protein